MRRNLWGAPTLSSASNSSDLAVGGVANCLQGPTLLDVIVSGDTVLGDGVLGVAVPGSTPPELPGVALPGVLLPGVVEYIGYSTVKELLGEASHDASQVHRASSSKMTSRETCTRFETRSEESRVGKECRSRWSPYH